MVRHAIIDTGTGLVVNIVEYETDISNTVPPGMEAPMLAVASETAQIGWSYDDKVFINPVKTAIGSSQYDWGPKLVDVIGSY